jgi:hypothetical protein
MKTTNAILIATLIFGFLIGLLGSVLKIIWAVNADVLFLLSLILMPVSVIGLIINNREKIRQALK